MTRTQPKVTERRIILKIPESVVKMAQKAKLPNWATDSFTARVCWVVEEWYEGRGRKGVKPRAETNAVEQTETPNQEPTP